MTERIYFPDVVTYRTEDGAEHACPPQNQPYTIEVKNLALYEGLCRTGYAFCADHTGRAGKIIDQRNTT